MSETLHTERLTADTNGIRRAAELLKAGKPVAFGPATVSGPGALASSATAAARIFAA